MKVTTITARYARKLNTGNFSNVDLETWATIELEEGDTAEDALAYGLDLCRDAVKEAAAPFVHTGKNGSAPAIQSEPLPEYTTSALDELQ